MEYLIGSLLAPNIAGIILSGAKDKAKEIQIEKELNQVIMNLNLKYENQEIDCGTFEKFLYENVEIIKGYFINLNVANYKIDSIFIDEISEKAIKFINCEKEKINHSKLKDESIVKQYFKELLLDINNIIESNLALTDKVTINAINRNTDNNCKDIKNQNNHVIEQNNEVLAILKAMQSNINQEQSNTLDKKLISKLKNNNISFSEEASIKIEHSNHEVKGIFLVKYNKFLSKFKNLSEVLNYSYMTQTPVTLEPVAFKLIIDGEIIQEFKYPNEDDSLLIPLEFNSEGGIEIATGYFENNKNENKVLSELTIIPQEKSFSKSIRLENENFETIIDNLNVKIEDIINKDNITTTVMSNKHQENSQVHITFKPSIDRDGNIVSNSTNFEIIDSSNALSIMYWINIMIKVKQSTLLRARMIEGNDLLFEGVFNFDDDIDLEIEKDLIQKILYIENKLEIKFNLPSEPIVNYIDEINYLKSTLDTGVGHINIPSFSMENKEDKLEVDIPKDTKVLMNFISKDKFEIFNEEIDLGEKIIIITEACIRECIGNKIIMDVCQDSTNLSVSKKFYNGDFDVKSILKEQNLGELA